MNFESFTLVKGNMDQRPRSRRLNTQVLSVEMAFGTPLVLRNAFNFSRSSRSRSSVAVMAVVAFCTGDQPQDSHMSDERRGIGNYCSTFTNDYPPHRLHQQLPRLALVLGLLSWVCPCSPRPHKSQLTSVSCQRVRRLRNCCASFSRQVRISVSSGVSSDLSVLVG